MSTISTARYPNAECPACRRPIGPDDQVHSCAACELTFHAQCWSRNGGCAVEGCVNAGSKPQTVASTARPAAPALSRARRDQPFAFVLPVPVGPDQAGTWVRAFVAMVGMAVFVTGVLAIWHWHRYQARRELIAVIRHGEEDANPRRLVAALGDYVRTHPRNDLTQLAGERLERARLDLEQYDFAQADAIDHP